MIRLFLTFFVSIFMFCNNSFAIRRVCFDSECVKDVLLQLINRSESNIDFSVYYFANNDVYEALVVALNRGVCVRVIVDHYNYVKNDPDTEKLVNRLFENGAQIFYNKDPNKKNHGQFMLFDNKALFLTGYYLDDKKSSLTYENSAIVLDEQGVVHYLRNFERMCGDRNEYKVLQKYRKIKG